ncbi:MAG: ATPase, T2SS/T4P/T4SS family [Bacilli bacterium]|nr:ATPase, T2SS/T4P/T4SS family [Bacilli bacterium]
MEQSNALTYIKNSFLKDLLNDENVTDISYNGQDLYYVHNLYGRRKADINISLEQAKDFIRQIANISMKQFSFQNPLLDVSIEKYRINAVHQSIGRYLYQPVVTFSLRIGSEKILIDNKGFITDEMYALLKALLDNNISLVIGGKTGVGKTELQKYLLSIMEDNTRVITIDNVLELNNIPSNNLDLTTWQIDERFINNSIQDMVKNALRNNPDWIIVAEARGKEMLEILSSALTGHSIITTIHALDIENMPNRIVSMIRMNDMKFSLDSLYKDIYHHLPIYIYLSKDIDQEGRVHRYIDSVMEITDDGEPNYLYRSTNKKYGKVSPSLAKRIKRNISPLFQKTFMRKDK